nr:MAG: hypothetical protein [Lokiarchaeota virus Ratatoskr Meg22_1012]
MKMILISALNDYGWWRHETNPPKYYNWGALGDLFPNDVYYINLNEFMKPILFHDMGDIDIVFVQQCKGPENFHVKVFKKVKSFFPKAKIVMLQEDDISMIFRMSPQGQVDHFKAVKEYVDMVYVHEDERAMNTYSMIHDNVKTFYTPYPVKWVKDNFLIPFDKREYELLVIGSVSKVYNGILSWLFKEKYKLKTLATMCERYNGRVEGLFENEVKEMHWHSWLREIANCKYYYNSMWEIGSRSFRIACGALGIAEVIHSHENDLVVRSIAIKPKYDFSVCKNRIKDELESLIWGVKC